MGHDNQAPLLDASAPATASYPPVPQQGPLSYANGHLSPADVRMIPEYQQHHMTCPPVVLMHPTQVQQPPAVAVQGHPVHPHLPGGPGVHLCPACQSHGPMKVKRENGLCAWLSAFFLCWVCCPIFWVPFCIDADKDLVHRCSVCDAEIARTRPWE